MAVDPLRDPALRAFQRFGYGARPGDYAAVASDPRAALLAELVPEAAPIAGLPTTSEALQDLYAFLQVRREERRRVAAEARGRAPAMAEAMEPGGAEPRPAMDAADEAAREGRPRFLYQEEVARRLERLKSVQIGYLERLVAFWTNHFAVEARKGQRARALVGAFEREAIRPHVLGRFADLAGAVSKHAAMLVYLDNFRSVGPNSLVGENLGQGLNENYARELLELHTVGVGAGYTQADVTALARILTGWTVQPMRVGSEQPGAFLFSIARHEPGAQTVLGKTYPAGGVEQGEAVIADLARHPATARHIATKLATAFASDTPDPALVATLERAFRDSDGDLGHVSRVLVETDAAWMPPAEKLRSPFEFVAAAVRALDLPVGQEEARYLLRALRALGEETWNPASPKGFPILGREWLAPDALTNRLDLAQLMAQRSDPDLDPRALLEAVVGPSASAETRQAVARAETRRQGLALVLMSPEFQRR